MDKKYVILLMILAFVVIGFVISLTFPQTYSCTKIGCACQGDKTRVPCNDCGFYKPSFFTGLINYGKACNAKEVFICENGKNTGTEYDIDESTCNHRLRILSI